MPSKATRCKGHVDDRPCRLSQRRLWRALAASVAKQARKAHCSVRPQKHFGQPASRFLKQRHAREVFMTFAVNHDSGIVRHLLDRRLLPATCARAFTREPRPIMAFAEMDLVWAKVVDHLPHRGANSSLILLPPAGPLCCDPAVGASQRRNRLYLSRWMCIRKKGEPSLTSKRTSKRQTRPHSTSQSFFEQASLALFARAPQPLAQWSPTGPSARGPLRRAVAPPLAQHPARD